MSQGAGNAANGNLVKGAGCGTRNWNEDFKLTDTDGATALFSVAKATGNTAIAGTLVVTGALTASNVTSVTTNLALAGTLGVAGIASLSGIETGLTAHSGGTQASGLALSTTKPVHNVTTVAAGNDSVLLPASTGGGAVHIVMNSAAANSMQVYGSGTDTINAVATATGVALAAGKSAVFVDYAAGTWFMLKSA